MTLLGLGALLALPAMAQSQTVSGEVIQIEQKVRTQNEGELQQITVRTRQGEQVRLNLGEAGWCDDCVHVGDRVRVRTMRRDSGTAGEPLRVRSMRNETTGQKLRVRDRSGDLVQMKDRDRARLRLRDGSCGDCPLAGAGSGPSGAGGRGRGRGRGGGGGGGR
jgi:hypothetical protein